MKIVFFGSPSSALPSFKKILEAGHRIELLITQPDKPSGRGRKHNFPPTKKFAIQKNIPVHQPVKITKDREITKILNKIKPDMNVVVAYGQIIPNSVIYFPTYNSLNLHFSLLPKYRGASPVQWSILKGEIITGVTIFELNEKMDEGDILAQKKIKTLTQENSKELEARLAKIGADLLVETIAQIDSVKRRKQKKSQAIYAPKLKKEDGKIDWKDNAINIDRLVRALTPWPSAYTFFKEKRIKILKGQKEPFGTNISASPGNILNINKKGILVNCGDNYTYLIEILKPENRKEMSSYSFSLGAGIKIGDNFD